jgi:hypothetical protein
MAGKLVVHRKGYVRKDGTRVKASTFKIKDRGKKGRTPKSKRWYKPKVKMDWEKGMPMAQRRRNALRAHGGDELSTARALQALANVTTDNATKVKAKADANYFYKRHERSK